MLNVVTIIGRLTTDPALRYIPNSGMAVANFTLAVDRGLSRDKKEELEAKGQATTDFIRVVVWGKQAENCANYLAKGRLVGIQGKIQTGSYDDKDGKKVFTTDVNAQQVAFLEWGEKKESNMGEYNMDGFHPTDSDDILF